MGRSPSLGALPEPGASSCTPPNLERIVTGVNALVRQTPDVVDVRAGLVGLGRMGGPCGRVLGLFDFVDVDDPEGSARTGPAVDPRPPQ